MRQGGSPPTGKWVGNAVGGVEAPDPIILPVATERFARTAARLDGLANGHAMSNWLKFMAAISRAQEGAASLEPASGDAPFAYGTEVTDTALIRIIERSSAWRDYLHPLLDDLEQAELPGAARIAMQNLRGYNNQNLQALAGNCLSGTVAHAELAGATYVAAALQVYFTARASTLDVSTLNLQAERGRCPCCGSAAVSGIVTATGKTPGTRYLYCAMCSTAWNHVRAVCTNCADSRTVTLRSIDGDPGIVKAETCDACSTYAKMLYQVKDMQVDAYADDLASLGLDMMIADAGWARATPNPLLFLA